MTQLFFPNYCCAMDQITGDTPDAIDAFRRCNRLGPGQRLLPENFYVIPDQYTVLAGAALVAKMGLALTPAGWVVLLAGGVAVGFAAGYGGDSLGKWISSLIWDRGR